MMWQMKGASHMSYTAAVITVSDLGSRGLRQDTSGPAAPAPLTVVEGAYACHPALRHHPTQ